VALGAAPVAAGPAAAQTPATRNAPAGQQQQDTHTPDELAALIARAGAFSATVEMVRVPVIVVDGSGAFIENLQQRAFVVRDGGKSHEVEHFVSDADPVSVGILVDASSAMRPYEADVRVAVEGIARSLRPADELFLIAYGPRVAMLRDPANEKEAVVNAMADYAIWDGAGRALYDALDRGLETLEGSRFDKRSLIVIGAGGDTASRSGELAVQQHIHRTGVTVHAISLSDRPQQGVMRDPSFVNRLQTLPQIAEFTGGLLAQRPRLDGRYGGTSGWLAAAGANIATYVKHQYLLHYAPESPPRPGTWRAIRVEVEGEHKEIRARSGYMR
jgi:VWFA-related protein